MFRKAGYICLLVFMVPVQLFPQNARQYFRAGMTFVQSGKYNDAVDQFSRALEADPEFVQAYIERSKSLEATGRLGEAADDLSRAATFEHKDPALFFNAARLYFLLGNHKEALEWINKCILKDRRSDEAHRLQGRIQMALEDYSASLASLNRAIDLKENAPNYYYRAQLSEIMKNPVQAESDYKKAIGRDEDYLIAYIALARLKLKSDKHENAILNCNEVIRREPFNRDGLLIRSRAYAATSRYPEAIEDISKILSQNTEDGELYFTRGTYYQDFIQHQNAINDFSKVLMIHQDHSEAIFRRAHSYEQIGEFGLAIKDYEKLTRLSVNDENAMRHLEQAKERLFELNRESDPPVLKLSDPVVYNDSTLKVPRTYRQIKLRGIIRDASEIEQVLINKKPASFVKKDEYYEFTAETDISVIEQVTINIKDIYNNLTTGVYTIDRTETDAPVVSILSPYASDNGEIYLDTDSPTLYIEGKLTDESRISSILIDGITASYAIDEINPTFNAMISILNKDRFNVTATDVFGNDTTFTYVLNRGGISMLEQNPMGRTWVVFIENSDYESFPSLEGPGLDISLMRSALAGYDIHKIIHKQNMSKKEMERFFSIELRDLLRSNKVNSLLIWYAGHGRYFNETGFWLPTDARKEDEFTYYNMNALRASLQSFSNMVTHTLVISDACETGGAFNQVSREVTREKDCNNREAVKFKSAQAFTSAGYEIASDQSQFTKTFATILKNNTNACLPVEAVVTKVTEVVKKTSSQEPRFGKIPGLNDEGGTFFFMSKPLQGSL